MPGLIFLKGPFRGAYFWGAYLRRKICVSKLIGLVMYIVFRFNYRFCFVLLCIWGQFHLEGQFTTLGGLFGILRYITILHFSIYTLSDLGVLSNLIGSLSQANEHYSPPTGWIKRKPNKNKMAIFCKDTLDSHWFERCLRWLITVSSTFQAVDFDGSLLPLFISWCYNHGIKRLPNHWWTRWYCFRDTVGYHSNTMNC